MRARPKDNRDHTFQMHGIVFPIAFIELTRYLLSRTNSVNLDKWSNHYDYYSVCYSIDRISAWIFFVCLFVLNATLKIDLFYTVNWLKRSNQ